MTLQHILTRMLAPAALAGVVALCVAEPASAVNTIKFLLDSAPALEKGELDGTAVRSDGRITPGVHTQRTGIDDAALAYSMARLDDGVAIGTGNDGRIYRLSGGTLSVLAETQAAVVTSLVAGPAGTLYAGTLPGGKIMAVDVKGKRAQPFAQPEGAEHVWDLAYDPRSKSLYAATGPEGKIFVIDARGKVEVYYDSHAQHVMSLALDEDGTLYAGTSDDALVLRIRGPGRSEVVRELPGNEVTAVAVHRGVVAAASNTFPEPKNVGGEASKTGNAKPTSTTARPKPGKGEVWRIGSDGRAEAVLTLDKNHITSVQVAEDGTVFAGTGQDGRIYRIEKGGEHALWVDVDERQVLALHVTGPDPLFVTGDGAAVYRIQRQANRPAFWTSAPLDSRFGARWGTVHWRARGQVQVQTRSGNTRKPDATWTDWSSPLSEAGPIRSPAGRFLQLRARLVGDAEVYALSAYYLPQNQRALVHHVEAKQASAPKSATSSSSSGTSSASSAYQIRWKVDNADGDRLRYRLFYRAESQDRWRPMLRESEELTETEYRWDTSGIPDGYYRVRIVASDELDNPEPYVLTSEGLSEPILIDNHAPRIENLRYANRRVQGRAVDSMSRIARLEYAIDGGEWRMFFPDDDLLDNRMEAFTLQLPDSIEAGSHIIAIRAADGAGNARSAELVIDVKGSTR